jgi:type II secretory pathway pseudopilin PulG
MKTKLIAGLSMLLIASAATITSASAQEVTRAQVQAELAQLEQAGYSPSSGEDPNYPATVQAAEAKVSAQQDGNGNAMGGTQMNGSSASGMRTPGGMQQNCVGPVSFCNIYAGG